MSSITYKWPEQMAKQLIVLRQEKKHLFTGKRNSAATGWEEIIKIMGLNGLVTPQQCRKKYTNLVQRYKELKQPTNGISLENGTETSTSWPFYDLIDSYMSDRYVKNSPALLCTTTFIEENSTLSVGETSSLSDEPTTPNPKKSKFETKNEQLINKLIENQEKQNDKIIRVIEKQGEKMLGLLKKLIDKF